MTPDLLEELEERLRILEHREYKNVFQSPTFPHLNSSISGTVENQFTPTWYTHIHDTLEHSVVEYSEEDVESQNFLELKLNLSEESLDVYLYLPNQDKPIIKMSLAVEVQDIEVGTFKINSLIINELQFDKGALKPISVA